MKRILLPGASAACGVAPHAGAWIETYMFVDAFRRMDVAPHAGAWIETGMELTEKEKRVGRTPRGCVD